MPLFEFDAGRLVPAQFGHPVDEPLGPEVLDAVRDQVLEAIQRPLFPVSWTQPDGESRRLLAMDAAGRAVSVEVLERLDALALVDALSRAGRAGQRGWLEVAELYPRGVAAFRRDWNAFREAIPSSAQPAPRLVVVAARVADEVRPAIEVLGESGVAVHEITARQMSSGRVFLSVDELRPQAITAMDRVLTGRAAARAELPPVLTEAVPQVGSAASPAVPAPTPARPDEDRPTRAPAAAAGHGAHVGSAAGAEPAQERDLLPIARWLGEDTPVVWVQHRRGIVHDAVLTTGGTLRLPGGSEHRDPVAAARGASGREVDGWRVWRFGESGPSLADAWDEVRRAGERAPGRPGRRSR